MVAPYDSCTKLAEEVSEKELSKPNYIWYGQRYSQYTPLWEKRLLQLASNTLQHAGWLYNLRF